LFVSFDLNFKSIFHHYFFIYGGTVFVPQYLQTAQAVLVDIYTPACGANEQSKLVQRARRYKFHPICFLPHIRKKNSQMDKGQLKNICSSFVFY
jgi:hypothetical protein